MGKRIRSKAKATVDETKAITMRIDIDVDRVARAVVEWIGEQVNKVIDKREPTELEPRKDVGLPKPRAPRALRSPRRSTSSSPSRPED